MTTIYLSDEDYAVIDGGDPDAMKRHFNQVREELHRLQNAPRLDNVKEAAAYLIMQGFTVSKKAPKLTPEQKEAAKRRKLRDRYRNTVCVGCRNNRYNFKSDGERPGIDAPTSGDGCFNLELIKRGRCSLKG